MKALAVTAGIVFSAVAAALAWFAIGSDPLGGEPFAVVAIDQDGRPGPSHQIASSIGAGAGQTGAPAQGGQPATSSAAGDAAAPAAGGASAQTSSGQAAPPEGGGAGGGGFVLPPGLTVSGLDPSFFSQAPQGAAPVQGPAQAARPASVQPEAGPSSLPPAPVAALVEESSYGPLPRIAADGRRPSQVYARPSRYTALPQLGEPARIAILIKGLGLSELTTAEAISKLPAAVSLAFGAYGTNLQGWVRRARGAGHEVMLQLPLEPFDYPDNDPGPHTLLTNLKPEENRKRLKWLLARFTGYTGVTNHMGAKFAGAQTAFLPVLEELKSRGLIYLDDGTSAGSTAGQIARQLGLGFSTAHAAIDAEQSAEDIDYALAKLEAIAQESGLAIGVGSSLPVTLERVAKWAATLKNKGIVLIPVSAAVRARHQS